MTTATLTAPTSRAKPVTFPRVVASEWIKLRTVRATVWTLSVSVIAMAGVATLAAWSTASMVDDPPYETGAATFAIAGWFLVQLVVAVLGVLSITGEYGTGMIRSTFAAVPARIPALLAKALTVFAVVAVVSAVAVALSWLVTMPFMNQMGMSVDLGASETWRLYGGTALYLATIAVLAFAIGALVRHSAGALAVVLGLLLVVETVFASIPLRFFELVSPYLPATAGGRLLQDDGMLELMASATDRTQLGPWQGYGVLVAWVVVLLGAALVLVRRRDA